MFYTYLKVADIRETKFHDRTLKYFEKMAKNLNFDLFWPFSGSENIAHWGYVLYTLGNTSDMPVI